MLAGLTLLRIVRVGGVLMAKNMLYWQNNWQMGMTLACLIVSAIYIGLSLMILFSIRKRYYDVCISAFIPVVNIIQWIRYSLMYAKEKKEIKRISSLETEEISLW